MEEETCPPLVPCAKQSKMVSRYKPEAVTAELPTHERGPCYDDEFWNRFSHRPSPPVYSNHLPHSPTYQRYCTAAPRNERGEVIHMRSGSVAHRPGAQTDAGSWPVLAIPQTLPSPRELCRRKSGRLKRRRLENGGVTSVCYHLEDLKKRQSSIDELKRLKWGGYGSPANSEGLEGAAVSLAEELQSGRDLLSRLTKPRPSWLCGEEFFGSNSGPWSRRMGEQQGVPEDSRGVSSGPQPPASCLPPETFWGFGHQPEE